MEKKVTIREAAENWVRSFNAIQQGMIGKLMSLDIDDWHEVTRPCVGDRCYVYSDVDGTVFKCGESGEITAYDEETEEYKVELDNGGVVNCSETDFDVERDDLLPMWGTMWSFESSVDDWWLESYEGIRIMSECGFRIYESEEYGYFFGIDGCGYDFYEAHWIPLYKARGLQWHDTEEE